MWAKGDAFWKINQPGNLWNCKCDWEETDDPVTSGNPATPVRDNGLEGNPALTGEVFTDNASYIKMCKNRDKVEEFIGKILRWHDDFMRYKQDAEYTDVEYNYISGGMKATHKGHNFDKVGGKYEREVQTAGYNAGYSVILESEKGFDSKRNEGLWNNKQFEVAGRETATPNNILRGLVHCAKTPDTRIAILDFPNGGFDEATIKRGIARYIGYQKVGGFEFVRFDEIICVQEGEIVFRTHI